MSIGAAGGRFVWSQRSSRVHTYEADDLCACVWFDGAWWWDVSGPRGRHTLCSGSAPDSELAKKFAQTFVAGFRRGRKGALGR